MNEERERLAAQCQSLLNERAELWAHLERLERQLAEANSAQVALSAERDDALRHAERVNQEAAEARRQCGALAAERDEVRDHAMRLRSEIEEARLDLLWAKPGHFYSPIVNPSDPHVKRILDGWNNRTEHSCTSPPPPRLDEEAMRKLFRSLRRFYADMPFPARPSSGHRYYLENETFSYADGITLYSMLRHLKPRRFVEVGAGFSSCASMDTNDRFLDRSMSVTFIDPDPGTLLSRLAPDDPYRTHIVTAALQDVPLGVFTELETNDVLFFDSSHVAKMGSDVNTALFAILPQLRPGVVVHFHDVLYPFEYPPCWVTSENRSWNEACILRAFLQFNEVFRVIFFNDFFYNKYRDEVLLHAPLCLKDTGGSIWIQRVA